MMLKIFYHRYFAVRKFEFWLLPVCFSQTLSRHLGSTLPTSNCLLVLLQGSLDVFCIEKVVASLPDLLGVLKILGNKQKNKKKKRTRKKHTCIYLLYYQLILHLTLPTSIVTGCSTVLLWQEVTQCM